MSSRNTSVDTGPESADRRRSLERLSSEIPVLRRGCGDAELAIFGSVARGDDRPDSDVDVPVTSDDPATFDRFMGLMLHLQAALGRRVDLGTPETPRPEIRPAVARHLIHVA